MPNSEFYHDMKENEKIQYINLNKKSNNSLIQGILNGLCFTVFNLAYLYRARNIKKKLTLLNLSLLIFPNIVIPAMYFIPKMEKIYIYHNYLFEIHKLNENM